MSDNDSSSDSSSDDYKDTQKIEIVTEPDYNGVEIWNVEWNDLQVRRWRIPFPIMVIFIVAVTAIVAVAIYYYF